MESEPEEISIVLSCRACLQVTSIMYSLFDEYEACISMASILQAYLPSKISDQANLPNQLCVDCAITLIKFHNFIVIYRETQSKLNKIENMESTTACFQDEDSLEIEQIIIQAAESDEEDKFIFEIKPETTSDNLEYTEETEFYQCEETNPTESFKIEEEERISLIIEDDFNIDISENIKQYHCPYCDDIFLYEGMLNNHLRKKHDIIKLETPANVTLIKRRTFIDDEDDDDTATKTNNKNSNGEIQSCKLCEKSFRSVKSLRIHEACHKRNKRYSILYGKDSEKQFICDVCGRGFKKKAYLNDHFEIHDSVRRLHNCPICHKEFKGRSNFARHKRFHFQAKRQHICEACGIGFNMRSTLKTHFFLKHVGERNFQCLICSQFFSLKSTLEKHLRRHQYREGSIQAVKFSCSVCHMKYRDKSSLKRHVELKHDNMKFECTDCDKDYTTLTNLAKHRLKKHHI